MAEKILTLHPDGKQGVNISKNKYDVIKNTISQVLTEQGEMTYQELNDEVINRLSGKFDGKIPWYVVTVKLDLEARGLLERISTKSPQKIRLK